MLREEHCEELIGVTPARPGWFAFFHSPEDEDGPFWAKPVEMWGSYQVDYYENEELNGVEVCGMIVEQEVGMLDGSFIDYENFLGIFFSRTLLTITDSDVVDHADIAQDPKLLRRLSGIIEAQSDAQMLHPSDEYLEGEGEDPLLN
jgi:hypothetical protein